MSVWTMVRKENAAKTEFLVRSDLFNEWATEWGQTNGTLAHKSMKFSIRLLPFVCHKIVSDLW